MRALGLSLLAMLLLGALASLGLMLAAHAASGDAMLSIDGTTVPLAEVWQHGVWAVLVAWLALWLALVVAFVAVLFALTAAAVAIALVAVVLASPLLLLVGVVWLIARLAGGRHTAAPGAAA